MLRKLGERFGAWRHERKVSRYRKVVLFSMEHDEDFNKIVGGRAMMMATNMLMKLMDQEHIVHCHFCPGREQLRSLKAVGGANIYVCDTHFKKIQEANAQREANQKATEKVAAFKREPSANTVNA